MNVFCYPNRSKLERTLQKYNDNRLHRIGYVI